MHKFANVFKNEVLKKRTGHNQKVQMNPIFKSLKAALAKEVEDFKDLMVALKRIEETDIEDESEVKLNTEILDCFRTEKSPELRIGQVDTDPEVIINGEDEPLIKQEEQQQLPFNKIRELLSPVTLTKKDSFDHQTKSLDLFSMSVALPKFPVKEV